MPRPPADGTHAAPATAVGTGQELHGFRVLPALAREELQQDFLTEQPDRAEHLLLIHSGPLQAEDHRRHTESLAIARDLVHDARRITDDEAIARELAEAGVEALARRQRLVLLPATVGGVLGPDEGRRLRDRRRVVRRD